MKKQDKTNWEDIIIFTLLLLFVIGMYRIGFIAGQNDAMLKILIENI